MKNYIFLLFVLMISCNTDEIYIDVYDPVQEEIDSLNQRKTDLALIFSYLETEDINYTKYGINNALLIDNTGAVSYTHLTLPTKA